jgi:hypothetical protein
LTNIPENQYIASTVNLGLNNHLGQTLTLHNIAKPTKQPVITKRNYNEDNTEIFLNLLQDELDQAANSSRSVDEKLHAFLKGFKLSYETAFPKITQKHWKPVKKPWITKGIIASSKKIKVLHLRSRTSGDKNFIQFYKKYRKIYRKVISVAKQTYLNSVILSSENRSKTTWDIVKREKIGLLIKT